MFRWRCGPNQGSRLAAWSERGDVSLLSVSEHLVGFSSAYHVLAFRLRYMLEKVIRETLRTTR